MLWEVEAWRWIVMPVPVLAFGVAVYAGGSLLDGLFAALVALNVGLLAFTRLASASFGSPG